MEKETLIDNQMLYYREFANPIGNKYSGFSTKDITLFIKLLNSLMFLHTNPINTGYIKFNQGPLFLLMIQPNVTIENLDFSYSEKIYYIEMMKSDIEIMKKQMNDLFISVSFIKNSSILSSKS